MSLSEDAIVFGLGFLRGPKARLSFGGESAKMAITTRARDALNELLAQGYAEPCRPDILDAGRESYVGTAKDPHLGELARQAGLNPFDLSCWTTFEKKPTQRGKGE